ncbi:class I SAM-dependent methyltransferase [Telluria beijingensis]|uniref:class I SAM-dependent methyltransferase n=1 Tax=Telluria beijingensis TaxID=3068633 RepID=UPI0027955665|nr:class I SAM-dependent methyltransferase [Massilia sp. REN29]
MQAPAAYVTDRVYPSYFYPESQPLWLSTVARLRGLRGPDLDRAYRYCELGCGTGFNVILAAALNPVGHFTGVDINREHIELARALARDMGVRNVEFHCRDLQGFVQDNTVAFDIANCHGMWSWVAPGVQRSILEFVARHLKPKGLFCLHYMCHPGSTAMIPVHQLFRSMARQGKGDSRAAVARGLEAVERLLAAGYYDDQPRLRERLQGLKRADADALAHELLAEFFSVHHAGDIHWLAAQAGLSFIGSSEPFYNTDPALCLPSDMHPLLESDSSPAFVETLKDMGSRRPHRSDVFQKNAALPDARERREALDSLVFLYDGAAAPDFPAIATPLGPMTVSDEAFLRLAELARTDGRVAFRDFAAALPAGTADGRGVQAARMMLHAGLLRPEQPEASRAGVQRLAAIDRLLAARNVGLRLRRDCASGQFLRTQAW